MSEGGTGRWKILPVSPQWCFSNSNMQCNHLEGLWQHRWLGPTPKVSDSVGVMGWMFVPPPPIHALKPCLPIWWLWGMGPLGGNATRALTCEYFPGIAECCWQAAGWWILDHCSQTRSLEVSISLFTAGSQKDSSSLGGGFPELITWVFTRKFNYNTSMACSYTWQVNTGRGAFLKRTPLPMRDLIRSLAFWIVQLINPGPSVQVT